MSFAPLGSKVFRGAQALMLPVEIIKAVLLWSPTNGWAAYGRIDDVWLGAFFKAHNINVVYTTPPLVKHEGAGRSLLWPTQESCARVCA